MDIKFSNSIDAKEAYDLVTKLQSHFVSKLNDLSKNLGENKDFEEVKWQRDNGIHGGGNRYEARDEVLFNTASVNVSQVHYDDEPTKRLRSATAISTIIHPKNPNVPSMHMHISFTEIANEKSYFRVMADLNPAITYQEDKDKFTCTIANFANNTYAEGTSQGDKYFNIPALNRHRGVVHFYLEDYKTANKEKDFDFSYDFGLGIINTYIDIIDNAFKTRTSFSVQDIKEQLSYHTLYLFQVLTLDRGTTSGLLVHDQNDEGIMGSLPRFVDRNLLLSWAKLVPTPQDELVTKLVEVIPTNGLIDVPTKTKLAQTVRQHYKTYPESLKYQASGNTIPSTVDNHKK